MYAKVIVDVPARAVNRPFDYVIPPRLREWVEVGSRVTVPFGFRTVQGFVVDISEHSDQDPGKIKALENVMDARPPLTPELVRLSEWISRKYVCSRIAALQAMIPAALKAKYKRMITLPDGPEQETARFPEATDAEEEILTFVRKHEKVETDKLLARFSEQTEKISKMLKEGRLAEIREIRNRTGVKKRLAVIPGPPDRIRAVLRELPSRAVRQKELLQYFLDHPRPVFLQELSLSLKVGQGTVKALADREAVRLEEREVTRDPYASRTFARTEPLPLTEDQSRVFRAVAAKLDSREPGRFLLHGVTGSGKTEIYLQLIRKCLDQDRKAIVLVPEISLTPQMVERFKSRFGERTAVLHSRLSQGERYDEWRKIQQGLVDVVIGARSAIFAPFTRIGLIVIDEEHESSYKQEEAPKYHARDIAWARGKYHGAVVLLGSATPSLESFSQAGRGLEYLAITTRVEGRKMPEVNIVDMRRELKEGNRSMFSRALHRALEERLERQEQSVLLLNRRGHSTFVLCRSCGYAAQCPHCDIALTYHRHSGVIRCHYCGYARPELVTCPDCGSDQIRYFGTGTQKVEEELSRTFPGIRIIRMDVDTTMEKGSHEKWLTRFRNRQADVLLGTQMVAKGLDFPHVTLVGVIAADTVLHLPDFRAGEKTFQLLTQVAGRAGRHELPGEVYIQTYNPDHYSIVCAGRHDYRGFAQRELLIRRRCVYPPYCELVRVTMSHEQVPVLIGAGEQFVKELRQFWQSTYPDRRNVLIEVMGPVASPIPRKKDRYRFQCVVKYRKDPGVPEAVGHVVQQLMPDFQSENLHISIDVNPQMMM